MLSIVRSVELIHSSPTYDLSVKDNCNFFCGSNHSLKLSKVHNCAPFSKEERNTAGSLSPNNPDLMNYASMDVQSIFAIREQQQYRASKTRYRPTVTSKELQWYGEAYEKHVSHQMSNTVMAISHMEQAGSPIDMEYLQLLLGKSSPLLKDIAQVERDLRNTENVKALEAQLSQDLGKSTSLFESSSNVFRVSSKEHQYKLFLEIMQLPVVSFTKTKNADGSSRPAIDKVFVKTYGDQHPEVELFGTYQKLKMLMGTYVKSWYTKITTSLDSSKDHCLRPGFGFFSIVTGRLNSFKPSLQNTPARGSAAKTIKRAFTAPVGHLNLKYDYNAAEVRMASLVSNDPVMASSFKDGIRLRKQWIVGPTEKIWTELRKKGDVHIQSCHRFFNKWVDKSHPLREAIKAVVFGLIYGLSVKSLAKKLQVEQTKTSVDTIANYKKKLLDLGKDDPEIQAKLEEEERNLQDLRDRDWVAYANGLQEKMFSDFKNLSRWLKSTAKSVERDFHVASPNGKVRNLFRVLTGSSGIISAAKRRGQNAPIQGISSELGCTAGYLILDHADQYIKRFGLPEDQFPSYCRAVHDANYFVTKYEFVIPMIHITSYMATQGAANWFQETFGMRFAVPPEVELEFGAHDKNSYKWDWSLSNSWDPKMGSLARCLVDSLFDQVDIGRLELSQIPDTLRVIFSPWMHKETREYLQEHYPLLDVRDPLDNQMRDCIRQAKLMMEERLGTP